MKSSLFVILFPVILLISCDRLYTAEQVPLSMYQTNSAIDTLKPLVTTAFPDSTYPVIFEAAFYPDTKAKQGNMNYTFETNDLGKINIESGRIIANDPVVMHDVKAFIQKFPIGRFPVQLAIARTANDERVAFSRIVFSDKRVHKWEFALLPGQKKIELKDTSFYCYGVNAGTGVFIDAKANIIFSSLDFSEWENAFVAKAMSNNYKGCIHQFGEHNLATFTTGYGDGCYATYIGFDTNGEVCRLLTDFALVEWWKLD